MKKWLTAVLFGTVLVLGACGGGGDTNDNADGADTETETDGAVDASAAEDAYKASCASCHGGDLSGGVGPALDTIGATMSADQIEDIIANGQGSMPGGLLSGDDATAVAEWLADHK